MVAITCNRHLPVALMLAALVLSGCAEIQGFGDDPVCGTAELATLKDRIKNATRKYDKAGAAVDLRTMQRNRIVNGRIAIGECDFNDFEKKLWTGTSGLGLGGDLAVLILGGLGATTGHAATASALAAASADIAGGQAAISQRLFYERTLPALLAQMTANRERVKASIYQNLLMNDDRYPLEHALTDLAQLARASGLPSAIEGVTETAVAAKVSAVADTAVVLGQAPDLPKPVQDELRAFTNRIFDLAESKDPSARQELASIAGILNVPENPDITAFRKAIVRKLSQTANTPDHWDNLKKQFLKDNIKLSAAQ